MMSLFIFRRDFRSQDNLALYELSKSGPTIPIFILDPFQLDVKNIYFSQNSLNFMIGCLADIKIPMQFFEGNPADVVSDIIANNNIKMLGFNADFSPYSKKRDAAIIAIAAKSGVDTVVNNIDLILDNTDNILPTVSKVFGIYAKKEHNIQKPVGNVTFSYSVLKSSYKVNWARVKSYGTDIPSVGRTIAINHIKKYKNYNASRDNVSLETSRMSAYLKYGCISIRELYWFSKCPIYRRQLLWRSFYIITGATRDGYSHIETRFEKLPWSNNKHLAELLWTGKSGFPLIDAGVRQLIATGWMHNRARLAVANFSVKIMHLNPFRDGSKMDYWSGQVQFSKYLIDCCWALNYGNWMWILGPYDSGGYRYGKVNTFSGRMFKDAIQPKKIDPELTYIRRWIPELINVSDRDITRWHESTIRAKYSNVIYEPILDYEEQLQKWYIMTTK